MKDKGGKGHGPECVERVDGTLTVWGGVKCD